MFFGCLMIVVLSLFTCFVHMIHIHIHIYVLHTYVYMWHVSGDTLPLFPIRTGGRIISPITLVNLHTGGTATQGIYIYIYVYLCLCVCVYVCMSVCAS